MSNFIGKAIAFLSVAALSVSIGLSVAKETTNTKANSADGPQTTLNSFEVDTKLQKEIKYLSDYEVKFASALLNQVFMHALRENGFSQSSSMVIMNNKPYLIELNKYSIIYQGEPENLRRFSARNIFELKNTEEAKIFAENSNILYDFRENDSSVKLSEAKDALANLLSILNISYDEIVKVGTSVTSADSLIQASYNNCKPFLDGLFAEASSLPNIEGKMLLDQDSKLSTNQQVINYISENMDALLNQSELEQ